MMRRVRQRIDAEQKSARADPTREMPTKATDPRAEWLARIVDILFFFPVLRLAPRGPRGGFFEPRVVFRVDLRFDPRLPIRDAVLEARQRDLEPRHRHD